MNIHLPRRLHDWNRDIRTEELRAQGDALLRRLDYRRHGEAETRQRRAEAQANLPIMLRRQAG